MCVSVIMICLVIINIYFIIIPWMFSVCFLKRERKGVYPGGNGSQQKKNITGLKHTYIHKHTHQKTQTIPLTTFIGLVNLSN